MRWIFRCSYIVVIFLLACGSDDDKIPSTAIQSLLNDTGITLCGDYSSSTGQNTLDCALAGSGIEIHGIDGDGDIVPAGQDAHYGRDINQSSNHDVDGHAGFSFTKLDSGGHTLPESAISWVCIRDNVTGLIWEMKTDNNGLQDKDWQYTWFNPDGSINGGNAGAPDAGTGAGSDNCFNAARCDTEKYIADINSQLLCGMDHWRLPSSEELQSIVSMDRVLPAIDHDFFPHTAPDEDYWATSPVARDEAEAWYVNFYNGIENKKNKGQVAAVRLVHNGRRSRNNTYYVP